MRNATLFFIGALLLLSSGQIAMLASVLLIVTRRVSALAFGLLFALGLVIFHTGWFFRKRLEDLNKFRSPQPIKRWSYYESLWMDMSGSGILFGFIISAYPVTLWFYQKDLQERGLGRSPVFCFGLMAAGLTIMSIGTFSYFVFKSRRQEKFNQIHGGSGRQIEEY